MKIPVIFLLHPVGVGATRAMNVLSAKLWLRALVDLLPGDFTAVASSAARSLTRARAALSRPLPSESFAGSPPAEARACIGSTVAEPCGAIESWIWTTPEC